MLIGLNFPSLALMMLAGVLLDLLLGEPTRWHPLVGFGRWAGWMEHKTNQGNMPLLRGVLAWVLVILPGLAIICWLLQFANASWSGTVVNIILLYFCIGLRSLHDHNLPIFHALENRQLAHARTLTSRIVSRDTSHATPSDLAKASTESLLENGNDAVFATLFWFVVAGGVGAVLFRMVNTLDAMWGYRSARFNLFGRTAARIDDAMNWVPARLTALSYVVLALDKRLAMRCWRSQAGAWPSPNAGPVMASGAGALGLALGGDAIYDGILEHRPLLGMGRAAQAKDIVRAWHLVAAVTALWLFIALCTGVLVLGLDWEKYARTWW